MKVLITGGSGRIGSECLKRVREIFSAEDSIHILEHVTKIPQCEQGFFREIKTIYEIKENYDFCLHLAALTDSALCSGQRNMARIETVNVFLTLRILQRCGYVLLVSSDDVFLGTQDEYNELAFPNPHNYIGQTKLQAEKCVIARQSSVIRLQSALGVQNSLMETAVDILKGKLPQPAPMKFWKNIFLRPSWIEDFLFCVKIISQIKPEESIFHCGCPGRIFSRADIARYVLEFFRKNNIERATDTIDEEICAEPYPRRLVLNTDWTQKKLNVTFTDSEIALEKHLKQVLFPNL